MAETGDLFLNVTQSFSGRRWVDRLDPAGRRMAAAIADAQGIGELAARVLVGRGVSIETARDFLHPTLRALMPDPSSLQAMDAAAARLADAIEGGENVGIFGDYDVDGACSAALLARYLEAFGVNSHIHIPDRIGEGYGPNIPAIDALRATNIDLLVMVDCGTVSHEALAHTAAIGLDTLVLDHHQASDTLPPALAVVNPNRADDISGLGHLCAAGVTFMTLVAVNRALRQRQCLHAVPDLMQWLDLVSLATVCDVVPLVGLNRAFVTRGLEVMAKRTNIGIAALADAAGIAGAILPYHLGYVLGPRINAGGRIGDSGLGARLLVSHDPAAVQAMAGELNRLNRARQAIEKAAVDAALDEASAAFSEEQTLVIASADDWHPGIVGLVAARLKERFQRPAFAIAFDGDKGSGSGRSISGVDLGGAVRAAVAAGILEKGGGHAMAAGLTVERRQLGALRAFLADTLQGQVMARRDAPLLIDGALSAGGATLDQIHALSCAEPYGSGNPEPVVALPAHQLTYADATEQGHIRIGVAVPGSARLSGIAFRAAGTPLGDQLIAARGQRIHVAGALRLDRWQGRESVSLHVRDAAAPSI